MSCTRVTKCNFCAFSHLRLSVLLEEVLGDVRREDVVEQLVGVPPHLRHLLELLPRLLLPQEVQRRVDLHLPPVVQHQEDEQHEDDAESI